MSQTTRLAPSRIAVKFNVAIDIESLLLERLQQLPEKRREEWLRALLIKGFQKECGELRKLNRPAGRNGQATARTAQCSQPFEGVSPGAPGHRVVPDEPNVATATTAAIVSMASLRGVIGGRAGDKNEENLLANTRTGECA